MSLPDDIYSQRILELAANMPRAERLASPEATATAHSKLCGSRVTVDLAMQGDVVTDYGQSVKACLLGQSSAAVMGREIVGSSAAELREVGAAMRKMLKAGGPRRRAAGPISQPSSRSRTIKRATPRRCSCSTRSRTRLRQIEAKRGEEGPARSSRKSMSQTLRPVSRAPRLSLARASPRRACLRRSRSIAGRSRLSLA